MALNTAYILHSNAQRSSSSEKRSLKAKKKKILKAEQKEKNTLTYMSLAEKNKAKKFARNN